MPGKRAFNSPIAPWMKTRPPYANTAVVGPAASALCSLVLCMLSGVHLGASAAADARPPVLLQVYVRLPGTQGSTLQFT